MLIVGLLSLLSIGAITIILYTLWYGISPMPTTVKVAKTLISKLPSIQQGKIFELGSGWGTLAYPLARHFPSCSIMAYEISPIPWLVSLCWKQLGGYSNLYIFRKDFFKISLNDAEMIICYLYPGAMKKLKDKFENELKHGTWIVTHTFSIPGWKPVKIQQLDDLYHTPIYFYQYDKNKINN